MAEAQIRRIPVTDLLLSRENPRFDAVNGQPEAIRAIVADQKRKLVKLAESIVADGLNPSDLPIVTPTGEGSDLYLVLEGNRRIAALKFLLDPELSSSGGPAMVRAFRELSETPTAPIAEVLCAVLDNEEDANRWIELKHTGENDGRGTVSWDGTAVERFRQRMGKWSAALEAIEIVKNKDDLDDRVWDALGSVSVTNLSRLLNDPDVRSALGVGISEDGKLQSTLPREEALKGLTRIVSDLALKRINVNDIRSKDDRARYIETFRPEDLPSPAAKQGTPAGLVGSCPQGNAKPEARVKTAPTSASRKTLIPRKTLIKIEDARINDIYHELRKLNVDDMPNTAGVMLRVFLELSVDAYIERSGLPHTSNDKLSNKVNAVASDMKRRGALDEKQLKPINVAISSKNGLSSIDTLHAYVHNKSMIPRPIDLKATWDQIEQFIHSVWAV